MDRKEQETGKDFGSPLEKEKDEYEILERTLKSMDVNHVFSRREFLLVSGVMVVAVSALDAWGAKEAPLIIMDQTKGLVIADPAKCVGCRRCELACSEFNDGKASPTIARIKVSRNLNFGPTGLYDGPRRQGYLGKWAGDSRCLQTMSPSCALCERVSK